MAGPDERRPPEEGGDMAPDERPDDGAEGDWFDPGPGHPGHTRKKGRARRIARRVVQALMIVVAVGVGLFFFLVRTHTGQRIVLDQLSGLLDGVVNGDIDIADIRSPDLRDGVTLVGVRITGSDGRPFLTADSVRARYSWRSFLSGDVELSSLSLFRPVLLLTRRPGEDAFNVVRIFASGAEPDTAAGPPPRVSLRDVRLVDGTARVVYPEEGEAPPRALTTVAPDGTVLRRMAFDDLDAEISRALLSGPDLAGPRLTVEALSVLARMYEEPAALRDLEGILRWEDERLTVEASRLVVGDTEASGTVVADMSDPEGMVLAVELTTPGARLEDFQWAEPRLPSGAARGGFGLRVAPAGVRLTFTEMTADLGGSELRADGAWDLAGDAMSFDDLDLAFSPLDLDRLAPWVEADIPVDGLVTGDLRLDGAPESLDTEAHLTLEPADTAAPASTVDLTGVLHLGEDLGVTGLQATVSPLDYALATRLAPGPAVSGEGRLRIDATGRLATGFRFTVNASHRDRGVPASMVVARGSVREMGERTVLDVTADLGPLSFTALKRYVPSLPLSGEVRGMVRAVGPLSDLRVITDLDSEAGRLALEGRFDVRDPGSRYRIEGDVSDFRLSALVPSLPDPTEYSGGVFFEGRGVEPATAEVTARLRARGGRVGGLHVDTAAADVRLSRGVLALDTVDARLAGLEVNGAGTLAVVEGRPAGEVRIAFHADSVGGLRPVFLGDTVIARDTLSTLERERLALEGIDADTLPTAAEVSLTGAAGGEVVLRGSLASFAAEGSVRFERLAWGGDSFVRDGVVDFAAADLPALDGELRAEVRADSVEIEGRAFEEARLDLDYTRPGGRFDLELIRTDDEDYRARALFEVDTAGGRVELEEMALRFDTLRWELADRATVSWDERAVTVRNFELVRPGPRSLRVTASGTLPREGEADFVMDIEGLALERITQVLQREDLALEGTVGAHLAITGTARSPTVRGTVAARDLVYRDFDLSRVEGEVDYADREIELAVEAWSDDLRVLTARGTVPADLALTGAGPRMPDEEMDLRVVADSLPAAFVLGLVETLEEVRGTVNGEFTIAGTPSDPEPSGTLQLNGAGFLLPALGVRYREVAGTLALRPDGTVEVDASARAGGSVQVSGTVGLEPITDPTFDLLLSFDRFRAVDRRDVEGVVSGEVVLGGSFTLPRVEGLESEGRGLVVDRGTIYLDEFQRSATVVDLSNARFFDLADTTLARARPILAQSRNPFLQNLLVNVDLAVERDTWLRSPDMNVEIGGDLVVVYDRQQNDLVLVGELQAIRGDYTLLGRRFEVEDGVVEFVGTPGINPNLEISARTRVRRASAEPLVITATVEGTLMDPRVGLGSPDAAVAEEDLISYLLFGQPTYALTSGQAASVRSASGGLLGQAGGAIGSVAFGTLSSRIGTLVAQEVGLDYFAISQPTDVAGSGVGATFARTTVELGRYLQENLFFVLVLRPFQTAGDASAEIVSGLRLEWIASDAFRVEFFAEDRFLRDRAFGFQDLGFRSNFVYGVSALWEWGY